MYAKVGISDRPEQRLSSLQTGCPFRMHRAAVIKCLSRKQAREVEAGIHASLAPFMSAGEWFRFDWSDIADRSALSTAIQSNASRVRDWKIEQVDIAKLSAMSRVIQAKRTNSYKENRRKIFQIAQALKAG